MSLTELILEVGEYIEEDRRSEFLTALDQFWSAIRRLEPAYAAEALEKALEREDTWLEMAPGLVDELEEALVEYFAPHPNQVRAFKKDMTRWFEYMRKFIELERLDGAKDIMTFYRKMFNRGGKKICGSVRSRCVLAGKGTGECMHKFQFGEYVCPECDSPRSLCRKRPMANGRCGKSGIVRGHGGNRVKGALSPTFIDGRKSLSRGGIFAKQLEKRPDLQRIYVEALADPDYLALLPEIALMAARRGELLEQLDALDPHIIEAEVTGHVKKMREALDDERPLTVIYHAEQIEYALTRGKENRDRWREINTIAGQMARLADVERKRLVEAKKSVPLPDMLRLQQETIKAVRNAVASGAEAVFMEITSARKKGIIDDLNPDHIRRTMLRHLAEQLRPGDDTVIVDGEIEDG